jgi:FkbM family methyltransferase
MRKLRKLLVLLRNPVYRRGLLYGVGATTEHRHFLSRQKFMTVLDAGANKGQFSLAVRAQFPRAHILAFEPLSEPAAIFRRLFGPDRCVTLFPVALGSQSGKQVIHISRRLDSSSLLPIGDLQSKIFPGTEEARTEEIRVECLDSILAGQDLPAPVLLKVDVQGFEQHLLLGAEETLRRVSTIYIELSFVPLYHGQALADDIIRWLQTRGFALAGIYNLAQDPTGKTVQADFHFERCDAGAGATL